MIISYNGQLLPADQPILTISNRCFRYGDGLFETIRVFNYRLPFFALHYQRLQEGMKILQLHTQEKREQKDWEVEVNKLLLALKNSNFADSFADSIMQKATQEGNFRLRLAVFRADGGLYTPQDNTVNFCIEASPLPSHQFVLNEKRLHVVIFDKLLLMPTILSGFKTSNALPYILAALHKQEQQTDDCLLLNQEGNICESIAANVFVVNSAGMLLTPPLQEGCINGVMRKKILQIAEKQKLNFKEQVLPLAALQNAQEVFLTNSIQGIQSVGSCQFNGQVYNYSQNLVAQELVVALNLSIQ